MLALLAAVALSAWVFRAAWAAPSAAAIGVHGDPWLFAWFLKWDQFALAHGHDPLVSRYLGVPDGVNLMWNTSVLLPGVLLAPVTAAFGPVLTYNLLVTLGVALSAWCAYLALRRYVDSDLAAGAGGLLYGFSPYMLGHAYGHLHLILAFGPPLMLALLDEILVRRRAAPVKAGALLGVLAAVQLLVAEELLASELLVATMALALLVVLHARRVRAHAGHAARALGVAAAVFAVLVAVPLAVQFLGPQHPHGTIQTPGVAVTDLANLVVPTRLQRFAPARALSISNHFTSNPTEWDGYLGLPLLLLLAGTTVSLWRRPLVRFASVLALGIVVLSLGPRLHVGGHVTRVHLPWRAVEALPVLDNMLPNRLMLYVYLLAGLLVALFADAALRSRDGRRVALATATLVIALVPLVPRLPFPATAAGTPGFFTSGDVRRVPVGSVALVAPFPRYPPTVDPMLWQATAGMRYRMAGGYFVGTDRTGRAIFGVVGTTLSQSIEAVQNGGRPPTLTRTMRARLLGTLRAWNVRTVIVGPMRHQAALLAFYALLLGRPPARVDGVLAWWDVDRVRGVASLR